MLAVDPRLTPVAREADLHLPIRNGTNMALLNGLLREIIHRGWYDEEYVWAHTTGFEELQQVVDDYPVQRVAQICDVAARQVEQAAELLGTADRLLSTVLQGFYQSNQATAAACQVNNLHLIRGMIGRPGAGLYQMNGQPTAQNTRETGADGDLPGMRNWATSFRTGHRPRTRCRSSGTPNRARSSCCGSRRRTRRCRCRIWPASGASSPGPSCSSSYRTCS
jgi:anaerobic selenocysteine-containing dehydrogenase